MGSGSVLAVATKTGIAAALLLAGLGLLAMAGALLRSAATGGEARSRADVSSRLRALDELVTQGLIKPEEYADRQAVLLKEL